MNTSKHTPWASYALFAASIALMLTFIWTGDAGLWNRIAATLVVAILAVGIGVRTVLDNYREQREDRETLS